MLSERGVVLYTHTPPHLHITAATLMRILKRPGGQAVHRDDKVILERSIFPRAALPVGLLRVQCMWYREEGEEENQNTLKQPEILQTKKQDEAWRDCTSHCFRAVSWPVRLSVQYVAVDKRRRLCVVHTCTHACTVDVKTNKLKWSKSLTWIQIW